jgi:hypothetical protein
MASTPPGLAAAAFSFVSPHYVTDRPFSAAELVMELELLLGMIHRLSPPLNRRPALFLEQKDELGNRVAALIKRTGGTLRTPTSFRAEQGDAGASRICVGARSIPVERKRR